MLRSFRFNRLAGSSTTDWQTGIGYEAQLTNETKCDENNDEADGEDETMKMQKSLFAKTS